MHMYTARRAEDIPYAIYLVRRGMDEHSGCADLMSFYIQILYFVVRDAQSATLAHKYTSDLEKLEVDVEFVLFVQQRWGVCMYVCIYVSMHDLHV